ncbi:hypothetical protein NQ318_007881 [Aromia moschata]|uniref:Vacuolar fusion protein CCZ1 homolog n=1 Tax=Aromia moschata TaxID=1265417 RepID=A0AAV8XFG8_9CUCU|nr:hypothetical protein NQ318_007881 [Aromia moschata]
MNNKIEATLKNFFIFNSLLGRKEGEEFQKILYYHPISDVTDVQIKNVGLVEGIIQFTEHFKPSRDVSLMHTKKTRQLYFQPEKNYWVVMTIYLPYIIKTKEGTQTEEYLEDDVQDNVYETVLKQAYYMYRLFWGTFENIKDIGTLKMTLEIFYKAEQRGTQRYADHLSVLNQYFVACKHGNGAARRLNAQKLSFSIYRLTSWPFITGPSNLKLAKTIGNIPKVHLFSGGKHEEYHFVVYRALSCSVCLFIDGKSELTLDLFKELDDFISPKLVPIVSDVAEFCSKQVITPSNLPENAPRFIYFNKLNLAYKSTVHLDNKQTGNIACSKESLMLMADMNSKFPSLGDYGETIVKTMNDYWIVGKKSNSREFYVALQQKYSSINDISDEVKKVCDTELKGIFFHPM